MAIRTLPDPTREAATLWLQHITREYLQNEGWHDAGQRFHGLVQASRTFAHVHFAGQLEQQEAFFDGLVLALVAMGHFADVERVRTMLAAETTQNETPADTWLQGA
jgi:hypothetical protein